MFSIFISIIIILFLKSINYISDVISKFTFTCPTDIEVKTPEKDLDGDYILDRGLNSKNLIEKVIYLGKFDHNYH